MNIILLGASSSGKTTYLSALFEKIYNKNFQNFITRSSRDDDTFKFYDTECEVYRSNPFPKSTQFTRMLNIRMMKQDFKLDISICDYRGGNLKTISYNKDKEKTTDLVTAIESADIAIIFIDIIPLIECDSIESVKGKLGIREIEEILAKRKNSEKNKFPSLICALTKTDSDLATDEKVSECKKKVREYFRKSIIEDECYKMEIFDVGTIGKGLIQTIIKNSKTYDSKNKVTNLSKRELVNKNYEEKKQAKIEAKNKTIEYKPYNVVSILAQAIILYYNNLETQLDYLKTEYETENNKLNSSFKMIRNIFDLFFKKSNQRKKVYILKKQYEELSEFVKAYNNCKSLFENIIKNRD